MFACVVIICCSVLPQQDVRAFFDRAYEQKLPASADFRYYQEKDITVLRWYRLLADGVHRPGHEDRMFYCCLLDITEEKSAEAAHDEMQLNMMASANPSLSHSAVNEEI